MGNNKYVKPHSLIRMATALIAVVVFISMFIAKQIVKNNDSSVFYTWAEVFFGDTATNTRATVVGFVGYLFVILGGLAGLAFVFVDELIGKDLNRILVYVAGGVTAVGGALILSTGGVFRLLNDLVDPSNLLLGAGPIVFGILSIVSGLAIAASQILEEKGY